MMGDETHIEFEYAAEPCRCIINAGEPHHHVDQYTVIPWNVYLDALNEYTIAYTIPDKPKEISMGLKPIEPGVPILPDNVLPLFKELPKNVTFYCIECDTKFTCAEGDNTCYSCGGEAKPVEQ